MEMRFVKWNLSFGSERFMSGIRHDHLHELTLRSEPHNTALSTNLVQSSWFPDTGSASFSSDSDLAAYRDGLSAFSQQPGRWHALKFVKARRIETPIARDLKNGSAVRRVGKNVCFRKKQAQSVLFRRKLSSIPEHYALFPTECICALQPALYRPGPGVKFRYIFGAEVLSFIKSQAQVRQKIEARFLRRKRESVTENKSPAADLRRNKDKFGPHGYSHPFCPVTHLKVLEPQFARNALRMRRAHGEPGHSPTEWHRAIRPGWICH